MDSEFCFHAAGTVEIAELVDGREKRVVSDEGAMFRLGYDGGGSAVFLELYKFDVENKDSGGSWSLNAELKLTKMQLVCLADYIEFLRKRVG